MPLFSEWCTGPHAMHLGVREVVRERPERNEEGQDGCPVTMAKGFHTPFQAWEGREAHIDSTRLLPHPHLHPQARSLCPPGSLCLPPNSLGPRPSCTHLAGFPVHFHYHILGRQNRGGHEWQCVEGQYKESGSLGDEVGCKVVFPLNWFLFLF